MSVETLSSLSLNKRIAADRQRVWDAWTQPERLKDWACPYPTASVDADIDLQIGGAYEIRMGTENGPYTAYGTYKEIDPPSRLVYTWDWREEEHQVGETIVTVEFAEVDGGTEVRLTHEGFPSSEAKDAHVEGWEGCLGRLEALLA